MVRLEDGAWIYWCPGCSCAHALDSRWKVDDPEGKPSVIGSVLSRPPLCHSIIKNGTIRFLNDCEHALRGQTVPMEPFPGDE